MANKLSWRLMTTICLSGLLLGFSSDGTRELRNARFTRTGFLSDRQISLIQPGLNLEVQGISAAGGVVSLVYTITDDRGLPLDRAGVFTPGEVEVNFVLAQLPPEPFGVPEYNAITLRSVTSPITNVTTQQPAADQGGTTEEIQRGTYRYTFNTPLPAGADPNGTYAIGIYAERDLAEFELEPEFFNEVVSFSPSGGAPKEIHDVVSNAACQKCHHPSLPDGAVEAHGGARQKIELCVMCHTPQLIDPDTGVDLDMEMMTHKIHMGANLPSVQAGTPYQVIGFRQAVNDYSHVVFPQAITNCATCHNGSEPPPVQVEAFLLQPTVSACGSCHDDVNFTTGQGHHGIAVTDPEACETCHWPAGDHEFDASIQGAHTNVNQSTQLEGLNIEILEVANSGPGQAPSVLFSLKNNAGQAINPASLDFFNLVIAGPTTDYTTLISESGVTDAVPSGGNFMYSFKTPLPATAAGTFAVSAEAYRNVMINTGQEQPTQVRETSENPVEFFSVTGEVQRRRVIVSDAKCEACHGDLSFHGGIRHNATDYCQFCHNPTATDAVVRPADQNPPQSIDLKFMIHRIHRGEELTRDFTVFGRGSQPHTYNGVVFPGDLRLCTACHEGETYQIPSQGVVATTAPREFYSPIPPNSAACLGCHDSLDAAAHTFVNTSAFGESCGSCHGPGAEFAVEKEHAR